MEVIRGIAASPGIVVGKALLLGAAETHVPRRTISPQKVEAEQARFRQAVTQAIADLGELRRTTETQLGRRDRQDLRLSRRPAAGPHPAATHPVCHRLAAAERRSRGHRAVRSTDRAVPRHAQRRVRAEGGRPDRPAAPRAGQADGRGRGSTRQPHRARDHHRARTHAKPGRRGGPRQGAGIRDGVGRSHRSRVHRVPRTGPARRGGLPARHHRCAGRRRGDRGRRHRRDDRAPRRRRTRRVPAARRKGQETARVAGRERLAGGHHHRRHAHPAAGQHRVPRGSGSGASQRWRRRGACTEPSSCS